MQKPAAPLDETADPAILLVEDDGLLRRMALELLRAEGLPTIAVQGAIEGLQVLSTYNSVKLLITDINMPGMSGLELLSLVEKKYPELKRLVISGRPHLCAGGLPPATEFLPKPFTAIQLLACVQRVVDVQDGTAGAAER